MSRLRDRLERRRRSARADGGARGEAAEPAAAEPRSQVIEQLRRKMERVAARHAPRPRGAAVGPTEGSPPAAPTRVLPGEVVETEQGPVLRIRRTYPPGTRHGREPVDGWLGTGAGLSVLARDARLAALPPTGALFLDTETTGLAGGTGTLPFLIGVGWIDADGALTVEQLLAREPAEEPAQLALAAAHLARCEFLVTFNGRAFDLPLVNTRFVMQRLRNPGATRPHLDLLHVARRIFGRRLDDRSLGSLEAAVLGFERVGDIPGSEIPRVYAEFVRGGSAAPLLDVLEHNALDLLALAALGGVLERMYDDPAAVEHAADHLGLARAALAAGEHAAAAHHLERASRDGAGLDRRDALHLAARSAARRKEHDRARQLWEQLLEFEPDDPAAHLALAKHYEHRARRYRRALEHARRAEELEGPDGVAHRVARIRRKQEKRNG
jgi:tetratricopeptide (TPR) repeat protein